MRIGNQRSKPLLSRLVSFCAAVPLLSSLAHASEPNPSEPFASGAIGELSWTLRMNRAQCEHPSYPSTWCLASDRDRVTEESGIEANLLQWIKDPNMKSVLLSYYTFTSRPIAEALCTEARSRGLQVDIFLHKDFVEPNDKAKGVYRFLIECGLEVPALRVHGRGENGWLHHAKIFLASGASDALAFDPARGRELVRWTSSSANLSGFGTSLHYDNWLLFAAPAGHPLASSNLCYFAALKDMRGADGKSSKGTFSKSYGDCLKTIPDQTAAPIQFLGVPAPTEGPKPLPVLLDLIENAKHSIKIAAHRMTETGSKNFPLMQILTDRAKAGLQVLPVFDDDTVLKAKRAPGSKGLNVSSQEVAAYNSLKAAGVDVRFINTNERIMALMHHKFMIIDDEQVWTGAGNFSSAALRGNNTEQFYLIRDPDLVAAYIRAWQELRDWSLDAESFTAADSGSSSSGYYRY